MISYMNMHEIQTSLRVLVQEYIEECKNCNELPQDFIDLIKHNFLAKYVIYNKSREQIEIGVEDQNSDASYPEIKTYKFPVNKAVQWLDKSFKTSKCDLEFYGKLLHRNEIVRSSEIIVMK